PVHYLRTPLDRHSNLEAEKLDKGGQGVAYQDNTISNQGVLYRTGEDVDIISPYANGYVINNFETREWLEYSINVTTAGTYKVEALVSSTISDSQFHVSIAGVEKPGL